MHEMGADLPGGRSRALVTFSHETISTALDRKTRFTGHVELVGNRRGWMPWQREENQTGWRNARWMDRSLSTERSAWPIHCDRVTF